MDITRVLAAANFQVSGGYTQSIKWDDTLDTYRSITFETYDDTFPEHEVGEVVFCVETGVVVYLTVFKLPDGERSDGWAYAWIHPDYIETYTNQMSQWRIPPHEVCHGLTAMLVNDIEQLMGLLVDAVSCNDAGEPVLEEVEDTHEDDLYRQPWSSVETTYVESTNPKGEVSIYIDSGVLQDTFMMAHEHNMTFNLFVEKILLEEVERDQMRCIDRGEQ